MSRLGVRLLFCAVLVLFAVQFAVFPLYTESYPGWRGPGFAYPSIKANSPEYVPKYDRLLVLYVRFADGALERLRPADLLDHPNHKQRVWVERAVVQRAVDASGTGDTSTVDWLRAGLERRFPSRTAVALEVAERTKEGDQLDQILWQTAEAEALR